MGQRGLHRTGRAAPCVPPQNYSSPLGVLDGRLLDDLRSQGPLELCRLELPTRNT